MAKTFLSLGSNLGNRELSLNKAMGQIEILVGKIVKKSSFYETIPWGTESKNLYINQVVYVETVLDPLQLLETILKIESELGRVRSTDNRYLDRTIDIDILFYDNLVIHTENLLIPHPGIEHRRFILVPLNEIAPGYVHPQLKNTVKKLLEKCDDKLMVKKQKRRLPS